MKSFTQVMGLTMNEFSVLNAAGHSLGDTNCDGVFCQRGSGNKLLQTLPLSKIFFLCVMDDSWEPVEGSHGLYKATKRAVYMLGTDLLWSVGKLRAITEQYAMSKKKFLADLRAAWTKLANSDMFDGPTGNMCSKEARK